AEGRGREPAIQVDLLTEGGQDRRRVQRRRNRSREGITVFPDDVLRSPSTRRTAFTVERQQAEQHPVAHVLQAVQGFVELAPQDLRLDVPGPRPDPSLQPSNTGGDLRGVGSGKGVGDRLPPPPPPGPRARRVFGPPARPRR